MRFLFKCFNCGWEGKEEELVEKPGNLMFYDYIAINTTGLEVTRSDHLCPKCGQMLRTHRFIGGMMFDQ